MRIVFLSDDFPPQSFGGAGISTYDLACGMKNAGHKVFVITTCRKESDAGESDYHSPKVFKIARDAMSFSFGKLETEKYLKNFDAHLTVSEQFRQARRRWNPLRNILIRHYLGFADKIFSVSNALKEALAQNGINRVEVMHTGIDISEYRASYDKQRKKIFFFAGRLSGAKGARVVEKAMQIISQEMPEAKLLTAGTNSHWLNREEMKNAYAASSVVIVPSICFDAFPRTVIEAMAAGRPVIGTRYGGASEAILDGVTGYVVNPFDIKTLAEKIMGLLRDEEMAERFGRAGRERVESKFNIDDKISEFLDTIENR